jgi:hypothetical protein
VTGPVEDSPPVEDTDPVEGEGIPPAAAHPRGFGAETQSVDVAPPPEGGLAGEAASGGPASGAEDMERGGVAHDPGSEPRP